MHRNVDIFTDLLNKHTMVLNLRVIDPIERVFHSNRMNFLIVEDHPVFRNALISTIQSRMPEAEFVEFGDERSLPESWEGYVFDFAIIDLELFSSFQFGLIERLHAECPELPILVMSMYGDAKNINTALKAGAKGFITKHDPPQALHTAIAALQRGDNYLSDYASSILVDSVKQTEPEDPLDDIRSALSKREFEVFTRLGEGLSRREVADDLNIALATVESHIERIKLKLNLHSGHELSFLAIKHHSS